MPALVASRGLVLTESIDDYPEGIILPVDKPYRWTSADVIRKLKYQAIKHFHKKNLKVGHAGTLDPLATGVLLVCIGKATKLAEELQGSPKQYLAGVTFGATTPSYDLEKEIDRLCPLDGVSEAALRSVLPDFVGEQDQVAPLFSAKSVDGVRAYETARKLFRQGLPVDDTDLLHASRINIYGLELVNYLPSGEGMGPGNCATLGNIRGGDPLIATGGAERSEAFPEPIPSRETNAVDVPSDSEGSPAGASGIDPRSSRIHVADISAHDLPTAMLRVDCSKGTYIRALARDLGEALGSGAFLSSLRRTRNGGIPVEDALSLDEALSLLH